MVVSSLQILPCEQNTTYFASSDGQTVILRRYDDQDVCDICNGVIVKPKTGEQLIFPVEHLREVITSLCEVFRQLP